MASTKDGPSWCNPRRRSLVARVGALGMLMVMSYGCCAFTTSCTLIGCIDGIVIQSSAVATSDVTLRATAPDGSRQFASCTAGQRCFADWSDWHPETFMLEITVDGSMWTVEQRPVYERSQPNGPCCGPTCRTANITITLER